MSLFDNLWKKNRQFRYSLLQFYQIEKLQRKLIMQKRIFVRFEKIKFEYFGFRNLILRGDNKIRQKSWIPIMQKGKNQRNRSQNFDFITDSAN